MGIGQKLKRDLTTTSQKLQETETRCIRIGELEIFATKDVSRENVVDRCFGILPGCAGPSGVDAAVPENIVEVLIKQEARSEQKTSSQEPIVTVTLEDSSPSTGHEVAMDSISPPSGSDDVTISRIQPSKQNQMPISKNLLSESSLVFKLKQRIQEKIQATVEVMKDIKPSPTSIAILKTELVDTQQPVEEDKSRQRFFTCKVCDRIFVRKCSLDIHKCKHESIMKKWIYHCDSCPQTFKSKLSYFNHRRWHSVTKLRARHYRCDVCKQVFTLKSALKRHRQTHFTREKTLNRPKRYIILHQYHCALCDEIFLNAENLALHQKLHSVSSLEPQKPVKPEADLAKLQRRFVCDSCGEMFEDRRSQALHTKLHTDVEFVEFVREHRMLQQHTQVQNQNKFACDVCGRSYPSEFLLAMHTRLHHAIS